MTKEEILNHASTPLYASPIPTTAHRFMNREHMYIIYKTDAKALRDAVPEPLEIPGEPLVRFEMMRMPDTTGYGDYTECGLSIPVEYDGVHGEYLHMMYLDNFEATASGREAHGYPKKPGFPRMFVDDNTLVGTLDYGRSEKIRIATATMTYKYYPLPEEEAIRQMTEPIYMLNIVPGYDDKPRICEINVVKNKPENIEFIEAYTGDARLDMFSHVNCPMNDLPVREIVSCSHIKVNLTLSRPEVVYDYLAEK
ncbi:MAG: acetoacetate decarboxylase [Eubacterium sp.]|nr:acetoacetate decarboxylase [Eubacterium sp.]